MYLCVLVLVWSALMKRRISRPVPQRVATGRGVLTEKRGGGGVVLEGGGVVVGWCPPPGDEP